MCSMHDEFKIPGVHVEKKGFWKQRRTEPALNNHGCLNAFTCDLIKMGKTYLNSHPL